MGPRSRRCWEKTSEARSKATIRGLAMTEKNYNQRRACALAGIDSRAYRSRSISSMDYELRERLKDLSAERRRFGYRRLHLVLGRWAGN